MRWGRNIWLTWMMVGDGGRTAALERYYLECAQLDVPPDTASAVYQQTVRELAESPWTFDPVDVARRRIHAAGLRLPDEQLRDIAREFLTAGGRAFSPADTDEVARFLLVQIEPGEPEQP
jgi:hypothetical protein